jgi:hypothetical protein
MPDVGSGLGVAEPEEVHAVADEERNLEDGLAEVRLGLPATPRFLRVARLAAASLVADLGVDLEGIEDLRVAIDELSAAVIADAPAGSTLELRFELGGGRLVVEGHVAGRWDSAFTLHPVATALLEIVADQYAAEQSEAGRTFRLVVEPGDGDASP